MLYYGFFNDDSHRTIPLQFDKCYTAGLNTFQNRHFYSVEEGRVRKRGGKSEKGRLRGVESGRRGRWRTVGREKGGVQGGN
jgi:hypothetical protein